MAWAVRLVGTRDPYAIRLVRPFEGHWLAGYDPDAKEGLGEAVFTESASEALRFDSFDEAKAFWMRQSEVAPWILSGGSEIFGRRNGEPVAGNSVENRPLAMATNVAIDELP